jgi:protein TonB
VTGVVELQVVVDADGRILRSTVISGHSLLVEAAIEAVRRYKFAPGTINGKPGAQATSVTVDFRLPN